MASETLDGIKVAIHGFEQVEMTELVSPKDGAAKTWTVTERGDGFPINVPRDRARLADFDAVLLPGVLDPDTLRTLPKAVAVAKAVFDAGKLAASICHRPRTVIEAGAARGRRLTSWPSLKTDPGKAGAERMGQEVVVDQAPVTRRRPGDIPAFDAEPIRLLASARRQARQGAAR